MSTSAIGYYLQTIVGLLHVFKLQGILRAVAWVQGIIGTIDRHHDRGTKEGTVEYVNELSGNSALLLRQRPHPMSSGLKCLTQRFPLSRQPVKP